jgi:type I restriction enzyme S subunit
MSFPRYPAYKDSGVEWLGEVPGHWDVLALKKSFQIVGGSTPKSDTESFWDGDILWATPSDLSKRDSVYMNDTQRKITAAGLASCGTTLVPARSIVLSTRAPIGSLAIAETEMCTNQGCKSLVPSESTSTEYFAYLLSISSTELNIRGKGTTFLELSGDELGAFKMPFPPLPEQTQIATFLDRETAKIDALVAEQRRLMALLKEKRQAVISHAVTRGLNPDAPLKPSGIEWLGDVPEHWEVLPIKRIVSVPITDGPHETPNFIDEGVPFVSAEAVSSGSINFSKVRACISEEDNARYSLKYTPKLHDIYMVKSGATTGITAIVEDRTDFNIWSPLAAIRCNEGSVPHFVLNFMRSKQFQEAVTLYWSFGTQQNIGMGVIENLACTVPPISEQHEIAEVLKSELAKFDTLTTEAQRAIDLLQERRTALISAAVTGQIDVRGAV